MMQRADALENTQKEKREAEDQMVGWHHQLKGHEFEQTLGNNEGQGNLVCCSSWCCRVGHDLVTEQPQQNRGKTLFNKWC